MVFNDPARVLLSRLAGVFSGDGVKRLLFDEMLSGGKQSGEAEAEAQKYFHADEGTGNEWLRELRPSGVQQSIVGRE